jgi:hypothetical protein
MVWTLLLNFISRIRFIETTMAIPMCVTCAKEIFSILILNHLLTTAERIFTTFFPLPKRFIRH